jgi:Flp pilus assembly protein TadG
MSTAMKKLAKQSGVAMIEFTIVLPVLLILTMATAEFGRTFAQYNTLTKAVRDGARYVAGKAVKGSTGVVQLNTTLTTEARNLVAFGNVAGSGTSLLPGLVPTNVTVVPGAPGSVVVTANYTYVPIFASLPLFQYGSRLGMGRTLSAAVTMRAL